MIKNEKQMQALKKATQNKRDQTHSRVIEAIKMMQAENLPISFQSVAKCANVSKTWLYSNSDFRQQIVSLRDKTSGIKKTKDANLLLIKKDTEIKRLTQKVEKMEKTIVQLHSQLEAVYGELYKSKNRE